MTTDELQRTKQRVSSRLKRYSNRELIGMIADCRAYLDQSSVIRIAHGEIKKPGIQGVMFVVQGEVTSSTINGHDVAAELERIWLSDLRFVEEAHAISFTNTEVILDFVTWWPEPIGTYVTGRIAVHLQRQR